MPAPSSSMVVLYRAMMRLYPRAHRERYGEEQVALFTELWHAERPSGAWRRVAWVVLLFGRALLSAAGVHRDRRRHRRPAAMAWHARFHHWGGQMLNDIRFTLRSLLLARWYAATSIGVIGMTLALAATVFAVVDGVLFRALPYPDAGRLVVIEPGFAGLGPRTSQSGATMVNTVSQVDLDHWRAAVPEVTLTGYSAASWSGMGPGVNQDTAGMAQVEVNFFDLVGVSPAIGGFVPADFQASPNIRPVVISAEIWRSQFERRPDVLGQEVVTDRAGGYGYRVVGVMPPGFVFPSNSVAIDFITPRIPHPTAVGNPAIRNIGQALARLPDGMTERALADRLAPGVAATMAQFPPRGEKPPGWSDNGWRRQGPYDTVEVRPLDEALGRNSRPLFQAVFLAVALLIVLASINLSSLMSARVVERKRELDVRRAIGAPWSAIARLMMTEAGVLIAAGAVLGVLSAGPLLQLALALLPDDVVLLKRPSLDWRVGGFAAITVVVLTALTAVAPTLRSRKQAQAGRVAIGTSEPARTRGRFVVVAAQVAGAFVLTVLGALLVGSVLAVYANDRPIRTAGITLVEVMIQGPGASMDLSDERTARGRRILEQLNQIPGVVSVGMTASQVLRGGGEMSWFVRPPGTGRIDVDTQAVTPGFYRTLEPVLVAGRLPTDEELSADAPVIVVGERVADAFWPNTPPLGQTLADERTKRLFTVVGVVRDVRWTSWDQETASIYGPYALLSRAPWVTFFMRTDGNTGRITSEAVRVIGETDAMVRPVRAGTLDEQFRETIKMRRFQSWLFGVFGIVALAVVGVGILGLLAMSAARRTKEIGIRSALGATRTGVLRWLWLEEQVPVATGLIAGVAVAAWSVTLVKAYLYGVTPTDPRVWLAAIALILVTAGIGAFVPAWRASRVDPLTALRAE